MSSSSESDPNAVVNSINNLDIQQQQIDNSSLVEAIAATASVEAALANALNTTATATTTTTEKKPAGVTFSSNYPDFVSNNWDPLSSVDWDLEKPSAHCVQRIKKDIYNLYEDPAPGICIVPDADNITKIHALITGPFETPYEGGFFYFIIRCPPNYPFKPPRVRLMTTSNNCVRFNPNLYKNGKVCLSILGTWEGPSWLPSQSISSVLMSIQSLLNSNPYFNEPGFNTEKQPNASKFYNDIIKHETIRVAVCENLENDKHMPKLFRDVMVSSFTEYYDYYVETCKSNLSKDSEQMNDLLFSEKKGKFKFGELLARIEALKIKIDDEIKANSNSNNDEEGSSKTSSLEEDNDE